ncbi:MAG TPA: NmrA family NAD(P)-binding protein [Gemmatimonadota bacterium]|nr:NmrA family NAD(P)-binding protein [Gemmatimonadota bacterium]
MRILVIGGTGKVGRPLAAALVEKGVEVRAMTRSARPDKADPGVELVEADLTRPESLPPAFEGVDRCYLLTPLAENEVELGSNAVEAAHRAGVERIVLQSVLRADEAQEIPHFVSKVRILERIRATGVPWVVVSPSSFYQNDVVLRDLILGPGIYGNPIGSKGVNRVDVRDIAEVATATLLEEGHASRDIPVVGPDTWTGPSIAAEYSEILGRKIRYSGDDLEAWAVAVSGHMPEWLVRDVRIMFDYFQRNSLLPTESQIAESRAALGHEPRPFVDFARELVTGD